MPIRPTGGTIKLTNKQEELAEELLRRYKADELQKPLDVVEEWRVPDTVKSSSDYELKVQKEHINPGAIAGTFQSSTNHFEPVKFASHVARYFQGEYMCESNLPPALDRRGDLFYVTSDGHHRSMAAKSLGIEELYVEYYTVPNRMLEPKED